MSDIKYFLRKKSMDYIEHKLLEQSDFELCYKDKRERIFKNKELLITCKNKYISVIAYDDRDKKSSSNLIKLMS